MTKHVKVLELDKTEYEFGLNNPLTIKYRDKQNTLVEFDYSGEVAVEGVPTAENPDGNNANTIDLSGGVYYATTAATASKVANPLTIHTPNGDVVYNGSVPDVEVSLTDFIGLIEVTYAELKSMRDNSELMPGAKYRIIDYDTIITGYNVANHSFDIIVEALRENLLSELCRVCTTKRDIGDRTGEAFNWGSVANWTNDNANNSDPFTGVKNNPNFYKNLSTTHQNIFHQLGTRAKAGNSTCAVKVTLTYTSGEDVDCMGVYVTKENDSVIVGYDYHRGQCTSSLNKDNEYYIQLPNDGYTGKYSIYFCIATENETTNNACGVKAEWYTGASYFDNSNLSSWEIKYSVDNNQSKYSWANINGKGVIYYMKDEYRNEAPYDFKNIKYGDYYTFDYYVNNIHYDGSAKYGSYCHDNIISCDIDGSRRIGLPKIYFKNTSNTAECHSNKFENNVWDMSFGSGCYKNSFESESEGNHFGDSCYHNVFEIICKNNRFGSGCHHNILKCNCSNNVLGDQCHHNSFNEDCSSNQMGNECHHNSFKHNCGSNQLGSQCYNNTFDMNCSSNTFNDGCYSNTFGSDCSTNRFEGRCHSNIFGASFFNNTIGADFHSNIFGVECQHNAFAWSCNNNKFAEGCCHNRFGYQCNYNEFGADCLRLSLNNGCQMNKFGKGCKNNDGDYYSTELGERCCNNTFGYGCFAIYLWEDCCGNVFGDESGKFDLSEGSSYNTFDAKWVGANRDYQMGLGTFSHTHFVKTPTEQYYVDGRATTTEIQNLF